MNVHSETQEIALDTTTLAIGIDIGWSQRQRSCAFAALDPLKKLPWPERTDSYSEYLRCCRFRLAELLEFLQDIQNEIRDYKQTVVILDGPLGAFSRPTENRPVDRQFRRGPFYNRMQPADIENEAGHAYLDATYNVFESLCERQTPWVSGDLIPPITVAETNPTVGLALLNPQFDPARLPSRRRPLLPPPGAHQERAIRAKSDFYWRVGGNHQCADMLRSRRIASERNHENVAGLYCLCVAASLAKGQAISCGDRANGVYVFPSRVHSDWLQNRADLRVQFGECAIIDRTEDPTALSTWVFPDIRNGGLNEAPADQMNNVDALDEEVASNGDIETLVLNDNGGIWQKHNDWLEGVAGPVEIKCTGRYMKVTLSRSQIPDSTQWRANPTPLTIAKFYGFQSIHFSSTNPVVIQIQILEMRY